MSGGDSTSGDAAHGRGPTSGWSAPAPGTRRPGTDPRGPVPEALRDPDGLVLFVVVLWFAAHLLWTGGVEPVSAWFALAIACLGGALLSWGSWRRPPLGTPDDFVDTNLAGVGRSLVLGAVVIFGFGVVAQQLDDDPAEEHRQDDPATQVRADAGGGVFRDADLSGENLRGLDLRRFDFTGSDLSDARLDDARLARAVLHTADLDEATLDGVGATQTTWPDGFEPVPTEC